jgi:hypothetical protein
MRRTMCFLSVVSCGAACCHGCVADSDTVPPTVLTEWWVGPQDAGLDRPPVSGMIVSQQSSADSDPGSFPAAPLWFGRFGVGERRSLYNLHQVMGTCSIVSVVSRPNRRNRWLSSQNLTDLRYLTIAVKWVA